MRHPSAIIRPSAFSLVVNIPLLILMFLGTAVANEQFSPWATCPDSDSTDISINRMMARYRSLDLPRSEVTLNYIGSTLWAATLDFAIYGTTAYALNMNGILIFDVSDPANPVLEKKISLGFSSPYNTSYIDGHYLYCGRYDHLHIFDVTDPLNPDEVSVTILQGMIWEIAVQDGRMYAGIGRYMGELDDYPALYIYDVTDPSNPVSVGKYESPWSYKDCRRFEIVGDYIYAVNAWNSRVDVIYIGDETTPVKVNHIEILYPADVIHDRGYLYIQKDVYHIMIYDISDPEAPALIDSLESNAIKTMEIRDDKLYASAKMGSLPNEAFGLAVYDIISPGNLSFAAFYEARARWYTMTLHDTLLFLPEPTYGYSILDISDPLNIEAVTVHSDDIADLKGLDVTENYAYVVNYSGLSGTDRNGYYAVDISDKENPYLVSFDRQIGSWRDATVYNDLLFVSGRFSTRIYSLTDPANPVYLACFPIDGTTTLAAAARGNILYVSQGTNFLVADISDPSNPQELSLIYTEDYGMGDIILSGNLAYVASRTYYSLAESYLLTVDISDPSNVTLVDSLFVAVEQQYLYWPETQISMHGGYIYYAGGSTGLSAIDIGIPDDPEAVYHYHPQDEIYFDVACKRNYLFALGNNSLQIFDLTVPSQPELIDFLPMTSSPRRLKVDGDYLYISCRWGFYIYEIDMPPVDCGDANADGGVDIDDVVWIIAYIFSGGSPPDPLESGDVDCSGGADIDDVVYLIMYIFSGGNAPCDVDGDTVPDC